MTNALKPEGDSGVFHRPSSRPSSPRAGVRLVEIVPALLAAVARHSTAARTAAAIANELVELAGARHACVYFADSDEATLRLAGWCNAPEAPAELRVFDVDARQAAVRAARSRLLYVAREEGSSTTAFALPLLSCDRLLGVVECELGTRPDARDFATLDSLGVVLGALVDRAVREDDSRARAEWTTVVAHELRQPLSAMTMQADWIASPDHADGVAPMARRIGNTVARLNRLVTDLTDASLLHIGRVRLRRAPVDLVELTKRALACHSGVATPSTHVRVSGEIPLMALDADRIEQVVSNLVTNAESHGRPGAEIEVGIERRIGEVLLSVTSHGPPIDADRRRTIFDRFVRGDGTRTKGLGVGLYVCRGLVEAHGGSISVTSAGDSTTFCVRLPLTGSRPMLVSTRPPSAHVRGALS